MTPFALLGAHKAIMITFENYKYSQESFEKLYLNEILPQIKTGICGLIYTQISDVEDETNGLITYDRRVLKVNPERLSAVMKKIQ